MARLCGAGGAVAERTPGAARCVVGFGVANSRDGTTGRLFAYRAGGGELMLVQIAASGRIVCYTRRAAAALPPVGRTQQLTNLFVSSLYTVPAALNVSQSSITSVDAGTGSYLRAAVQTFSTGATRPESLVVDNPRDGYVRRLSSVATASDGTVSNVLEFVSMQLRGMDVGVLGLPQSGQLGISTPIVSSTPDPPRCEPAPARRARGACLQSRMLEALKSLAQRSVMERVVLLVNHVIAAEPAAVERLRPHAMRTVRFELAGWPQLLPVVGPFVFRVTPAGLLEWLADSAMLPADLRVSVAAANPALALTRIVAGERPQVTVSGDAAFAADLDWLIDNLRWDLQDDLSKIVGDAPARQLGKVGGWLADAMRTGAKTLRDLAARMPGAADPPPGPAGPMPRP